MTLASIRKEKESLSRPGQQVTVFPILNIMFDKLFLKLACICKTNMGSNRKSRAQSLAAFRGMEYQGMTQGIA